MPNSKNYKKRVEVVQFELFPTDEDIKQRLAEVLASGDKKATYLKRLIREDIAKEKEKAEE